MGNNEEGTRTLHELVAWSSDDTPMEASANFGASLVEDDELGRLGAPTVLGTQLWARDPLSDLWEPATLIAVTEDGDCVVNFIGWKENTTLLEEDVSYQEPPRRRVASEASSSSASPAPHAGRPVASRTPTKCSKPKLTCGTPLGAAPPCKLFRLKLSSCELACAACQGAEPKLRLERHTGPEGHALEVALGGAPARPVLVRCAGPCAGWVHRECAGLLTEEQLEAPYTCPPCSLEAMRPAAPSVPAAGEEELGCFCDTDRHLPTNDVPFEGAWVQCDLCSRWCHGECAGLSKAEAEALESYTCPVCVHMPAGTAGCFCNTERHLPSNDIPFNGSWVQCDRCSRWCHGECAGLSKREAEALESYTCPGCVHMPPADVTACPTCGGPTADEPCVVACELCDAPMHRRCIAARPGDGGRQQRRPTCADCDALVAAVSRWHARTHGSAPADLLLMRSAGALEAFLREEGAARRAIAAAAAAAAGRAAIRAANRGQDRAAVCTASFWCSRRTQERLGRALERWREREAVAARSRGADASLARRVLEGGSGELLLLVIGCTHAEIAPRSRRDIAEISRRDPTPWPRPSQVYDGDQLSAGDGLCLPLVAPGARPHPLGPRRGRLGRLRPDRAARQALFGAGRAVDAAGRPAAHRHGDPRRRARAASCAGR